MERELEKQREREKNQPKEKPFYQKVGGVVGGLAATFATLFGVCIGILNVLPRISIAPQSPLVSSDAFSAPFVVSNDGYLPLYDVHCRCSPRRVRYKKPGGKGGLDIETEGSDETATGGFEAPFTAEKLSPGQKVTFPCRFPNEFPEWLVAADIGIVVVYRAIPWPRIARHQMNRFSMSRDTQGQYHWLEEPLQSR